GGFGGGFGGADVGSVRGHASAMASRKRHSRGRRARVKATGSLYLKQVANRVVASGIVSSPLEESPGSIGRAARQHLGVTGALAGPTTESATENTPPTALEETRMTGQG